MLRFCFPLRQLSYELKVITADGQKQILKLQKMTHLASEIGTPVGDVWPSGRQIYTYFMDKRESAIEMAIEV
jgi:hypothetical protein